jgi:hypothetical protein
VIATERDRELTFLGMANDDLGDGLSHTGDESGILEFAYWRIGCGRYLFKHMMAVKLNFPSQILQLDKETRFDHAYGAFVNTELGLDTC